MGTGSWKLSAALMWRLVYTALAAADVWKHTAEHREFGVCAALCGFAVGQQVFNA